MLATSEGEWDPTTSHLLDSGVDLIPEGEVPRIPQAPQDLTKRAARGFGFSLLGFLVLQLASFATYALAARYLSGSELGVVGKVLTVVFWMDVLLDLGMGAAIVRDQERGQTDRIGVAFTVNTVVAVVVSLGLLWAAPAIAGFFHVSHYVGLFRLLALLGLFRGLGQVPNAMLQRDFSFGRGTLVTFVKASLRLIVAVALLEAGMGPAAMAISVVVTEVVGVVLATFLARFRPTFRWDPAVAGDMLRFGLVIFATRLISMFWLNGDYLVVGAKRSNQEYGDYYTAFRLPELLLGSVYNMFSTVAFPTYSAAREGGPEKLRTAYLDALKLLCLFGFPVSVGMALTARDFIGLVFPTHPGAIPVMELLCVAGGFVGIGYASGDLFNAINKPRLGLYFNLLFAPIIIAGFLIFVDKGIIAVAAVHVVVIIPYSIFRLEVANRVLGTSWRQTFRALRPMLTTTSGVLLFALPLRLVMPPGTTSLVAIVVAGLLGGSIGLLIGDRHAFGELRALGAKALGR
jgi:PST family polysaccharide transporter